MGPCPWDRSHQFSLEDQPFTGSKVSGRNTGILGEAAAVARTTRHQRWAPVPIVPPPSGGSENDSLHGVRGLNPDFVPLPPRLWAPAEKQDMGAREPKFSMSLWGLR